MDRSKAMMIAASTFVFTTAAMLFVCANAHIDFFPCKKFERDFTGADPFTASRVVEREGTCSLMGHLRPAVEGEREELTVVGWALLIAFCTSIAVADSALVYTILTRKKPA
jgi:hypothetical protein